MRSLDDAQVAAALPWGALIESIEQMMVAPSAVAPARTAHTVRHTATSGRDQINGGRSNEV